MSYRYSAEEVGALNAELDRLRDDNQRLRHLLRAYIDQGDTMRELAEKELERSR